MSVGRLRWTWRSTPSTACWSWDARSTSASPEPRQGWGNCARIPDPCTTAFLGIESSPAFVRAPEGNGCAERFIRTLKENLLWVRTFDTVEDLRQALLDFREIYNTSWLIERHGFQTPAAMRQNQLSPAAREPPSRIGPMWPGTAAAGRCGSVHGVDQPGVSGRERRVDQHDAALRLGSEGRAPGRRRPAWALEDHDHRGGPHRKWGRRIVCNRWAP